MPRRKSREKRLPSLKKSKGKYLFSMDSESAYTSQVPCRMDVAQQLKRSEKSRGDFFKSPEWRGDEKNHTHQSAAIPKRARNRPMQFCCWGSNIGD
jgi:hypothetical protein